MFYTDHLLLERGNTTAPAPLRGHGLRAVVLWESSCLTRSNSPYPLKPHGTATLVNLSEGAFDLP